MNAKIPTTKQPTNYWRRVITLMMIVCLLLTTSPVTAWAAVPKAPVIPPPAMPAHVKRGSKDVKRGASTHKLSSNPTDSELSSAHVFREPLVAMNTQPVPGENEALAKAILSFEAKNDHEDVSVLKGFIAAFPKSRFRPALEVNLGLIRFQTGYLTDALGLWKSAFESAKSETAKAQKSVADAAVSEQALLEARLGHKDELVSILAELDKRPLHGAAEQKVSMARDLLAGMNHRPQSVFRCGISALNSLFNAVKGAKGPIPKLSRAQSTDHGMNLAQLKALSGQVGLKLQLAKRTKGAPVIVPSLVHFGLGHFAAIVGEKDGRYQLSDASLSGGGNLLVSKRALDTETDGFSLVPKGPLPEGWQSLDASEAKLVWGKGDAGSTASPGPGQPSTCPCPQPSDSGGSSNGAPPPAPPPLPPPCTLTPSFHWPPCPCGGHCPPPPEREMGGMARAYAFSMQATLNIRDIPLGYKPPVGPEIDFIVNYNQLEAGQPDSFTYTNLGPDWSLNWVSSIAFDDSSNATVSTPGGGIEYFAYPYAADLYTQDQLVNISEGVYQLQNPDGSYEQYDLTDGSGRVYMTQATDALGNSATISYDEYYRVTSVTDAISQESTFSYGSDSEDDPGFYVVTQIEDPFGRTCSFSFDDTYTYLLQITDVIGLTSTFTYLNDTSFINSMTTPYGTTGFYSYTPSGNDGEARGLNFTFADGTTSVVQNFWGGEDYSYFWNREAMAIAPGEPASGDSSHAEVYDWLLQGPSGSEVECAVLDSYTPPSALAYPFVSLDYDYSGETEDGGNNVIGSNNLPTTVGVHEASYNSLGHVTLDIDGISGHDDVSRQFTYTYADNDIDLTEIQETGDDSGAILGIWTYNSQHMPLSSTDGSGQVTSYTYNDAGQLETVTDPDDNVTTNTFDENGYLTQIQGPLSGDSDVTTISYDGYGRIYQITDPEGYTLTYSYDNMNRITQVTYPDGTADTTAYDRLDAVLQTDRIGRCTQSAYDSMDQLIYEIDPLGRKTQYTWCACGAMASLTDPNGNTTSWQRDILGRVLTKTYPDQTSVSYAYASDTGLISSITDAMGQVKAFTRDNTLNITGIQYSNSVNSTSDVTITWDPYYPRVTEISNGWGDIDYTYNDYITDPDSPTTGGGMLSEITNSVIPDSDITFTYDDLGRVTNRSINGDSNSIDWAYDAISRITSETNALGEFDYAYVDDVSGYSKGTSRLSSISYPNGQLTYFNWFGNLGDQRLQGIINLTSDGTCLSQFAYGYNPAGEITAWQQQQGPNNNQVYSLAYDLAGQLISAQGGSYGAIGAPYSSQYLYSYDPGANRTGAQKFSNTAVTISGTASEGDVVSIGVNDGALSGGQEIDNYTVQPGDSLADEASGLANAINADSSLQAIGVDANSSGNYLYLFSASPNNTTYSPYASEGSTEIITVGLDYNTLVNATVFGTPTVGDTLTISVHDPSLSGGSESVSYEVEDGDTLADIANNLSLAINDDSALSSLGVNGYYVEGSAQILSDSPNVTSYTQSVSTGATENIVFSLNTNPAYYGIVAGSASEDDVLTLTVYDAALSGGSESVTYTVGADDDLASITSALADAVNDDDDLSAIMSANTDGNVELQLYSFSLNPTTYRATASSGATETIVLGTNSDDGQTFANLGGTQYQYNNVNELMAISNGGVTEFQGTTNKAVVSGSVATNVVNIQQSAPNPTTYALPQSSTATETITLAPPLNGNEQATVAGTVTSGDVLSIIVYNASLPSGQEQISYQVEPGDTLSDIASSLSTAVNDDDNLAALGITSTASSETVSITQPTTTYAASTNEDATEYLTLGNTSNGNVSVNVSGTLTADDTITITASNAALSGGAESATYTILDTDTTTSAAAGLAAAINADSALAAIGITGTNSFAGVLNSSEAFTAQPTLSAGEVDAVMSATDGGSNTQTNGYQVFMPSVNNASLTFDLNGNMTSV